MWWTNHIVEVVNTHDPINVSLEARDIVKSKLYVIKSDDPLVTINHVSECANELWVILWGDSNFIVL